MGRVYAVASAKGGVGKTTTTANLAAVLAAAGADVAVVDADIGMANLTAALGVDADGRTLHDVLAGEASVTDATYPAESGVTVVPGSGDLAAFASADPAALDDVVAALDDHEFVFLDTSAGVNHESVYPLSLADEVLLVSTPDAPALDGTDKTRQIATRLDADVAGLVLTRVAPETTTDAADAFDAEVLASVPEDAAVDAARTDGVPVAVAAPQSPAAAAYRTLAATLTGRSIPAPAAATSDAGAASPATATPDAGDSAPDTGDDVPRSPSDEDVLIADAETQSDVDRDGPTDAISVPWTDPLESATDAGAVTIDSTHHATTAGVDEHGDASGDEQADTDADDGEQVDADADDGEQVDTDADEGAAAGDAADDAESYIPKLGSSLDAERASDAHDGDQSDAAAVASDDPDVTGDDGEQTGDDEGAAEPGEKKGLFGRLFR